MVQDPGEIPGRWAEGGEGQGKWLAHCQPERCWALNPDILRCDAIHNYLPGLHMDPLCHPEGLRNIHLYMAEKEREPWDVLIKNRFCFLVTPGSSVTADKDSVPLMGPCVKRTVLFRVCLTPGATQQRPPSHDNDLILSLTLWGRGFNQRLGHSYNRELLQVLKSEPGSYCCTQEGGRGRPRYSAPVTDQEGAPGS